MQDEDQSEVYQAAPTSGLYFGSGESSEVDEDSITNSESSTQREIDEPHPAVQSNAFTGHQRADNPRDTTDHSMTTGDNEEISSPFTRNSTSAAFSHRNVGNLTNASHGDDESPKQATVRSSDSSSVNSLNTVPQSISPRELASPSNGVLDHGRRASTRTEASDRPSRRDGSDDIPSVGSSFSDLDGMPFSPFTQEGRETAY